MPSAAFSNGSPYLRPPPALGGWIRLSCSRFAENSLPLRRRSLTASLSPCAKLSSISTHFPTYANSRTDLQCEACVRTSKGEDMHSTDSVQRYPVASAKKHPRIASCTLSLRWGKNNSRLKHQMRTMPSRSPVTTHEKSSSPGKCCARITALPAFAPQTMWSTDVRCKSMEWSGRFTTAIRFELCCCCCCCWSWCEPVDGSLQHSTPPPSNPQNRKSGSVSVTEETPDEYVRKQTSSSQSKETVSDESSCWMTRQSFTSPLLSIDARDTEYGRAFGDAPRSQRADILRGSDGE